MPNKNDTINGLGIKKRDFIRYHYFFTNGLKYPVRVNDVYELVKDDTTIWLDVVDYINKNIGIPKNNSSVITKVDLNTLRGLSGAARIDMIDIIAWDVMEEQIKANNHPWYLWNLEDVIFGGGDTDETEV